MDTRTPRLRRLLRRAFVVPAVLFVLASAYVTVVALRPDAQAAEVTRAGVRQDAALWPSSWSRRFPGCVAVVLWPRTEAPKAVLLRDGSGNVAAMTVRDAGMRLRLAGPDDQVRLVGICR
ncbi:MAG: hypothetical protein ACXVY4_17425 [Oryzihumus sp.]